MGDSYIANPQQALPQGHRSIVFAFYPPAETRVQGHSCPALIDRLNER